MTTVTGLLALATVLVFDLVVWLVVYRRLRDVITTNLIVAGANVALVIALRLAR